MVWMVVGWVGARGFSAVGGWLGVEEFLDGDGFVAFGAVSADADSGHEGGTLFAALFAEGAGAAGVALVDGAGFALALGG